MGQTLGRVSHIEMVGMDEVHVIAGLYAFEHSVGGVQHQIVPPHMGHLEGPVFWSNRHDLTTDPIQTFGV